HIPYTTLFRSITNGAKCVSSIKPSSLKNCVTASKSNPSIGQESIFNNAALVIILPSAIYVCFLAHSNNVCALSLIWKLVWKLSNFSSVAGILSSLYSLMSRIICCTNGDLEVTFFRANKITKWLAVSNCPFAPQLISFNLFLISEFCTTINFHGSNPRELGDNLPASKIVLNSLSLIFLSESNLFVACLKLNAFIIVCCISFISCLPSFPFVAYIF